MNPTLIVTCRVKRWLANGNIETRDTHVDAADFFVGLPTKVLARLVRQVPDYVPPAMRKHTAMSSWVANSIVDEMRAQGHPAIQSGDDVRVLGEVSVDCSQLASLIIGAGRLDEFPQKREALLSLANQDDVDRVRAQRNEALMLGHDPARIPESGSVTP